MGQMRLDENRILSVLEPLRKKRNFFVVVMVIVCLAMVLSMCITGYLYNVVPEMNPLLPVIEFFVGLSMIIVMALLYNKSAKEYVSIYKRFISQYVLQDYFDEVSYNPLNGFTAEEFRAAQLINWRNDFSFDSEDMIEGRYEGVEFKQSDIKITHRVGSRKNRRTVVDVDGRLTRFQYEKAISERILIVTDIHAARLTPGLSKVEMEDVKFNREFNVYSSDAHSVYYLLTPHFMEYLKKLRSLDITLYISFDGQQLYFLRSGKGGIFKPPIGRIDVRQEAEKNRRELDEIRELIHVLRLNDM